jgi:hypothetical protein
MRLIAELEREAEPGRATAIAFSIATGAERAAIFRALRSDLADLRLVPVHSTKRKSRERTVPIVAPWQKRLLDYVDKNADCEDGLLFRPWVNARRGLLRACARAGVKPLTWNDLPRTYGVWMRKLGVAPSLIAPKMAHVTSHMVETRVRTPRWRARGRADGGRHGADLGPPPHVEGEGSPPLSAIRGTHWSQHSRLGCSSCARFPGKRWWVDRDSNPGPTD